MNDLCKLYAVLCSIWIDLRFNIFSTYYNKYSYQYTYKYKNVCLSIRCRRTWC